jgi:hypothetical protein
MGEGAGAIDKGFLRLGSGQALMIDYLVEIGHQHLAWQNRQ